MPRPTTKAGILSESAREHDALEQLLATLTPEQVVHPGIVGEWSVKDVLALGKHQCSGILRHLVGQQPRSLGQKRAAQRPTRQQRMMVRQ